MIFSPAYLSVSGTTYYGTITSVRHEFSLQKEKNDENETIRLHNWKIVS